jgi:anti-sigma B factor antagonist
MTESVINLELGEEHVVRINGSVDLTNSSDLSVALFRAIEKGPRVVVDLSQADYLDSSAVAAFSAAYQYAQQSHVKIMLASANNSVLRILHMSGLGSMFGLSLIKTSENQPSCAKPDLMRQDWRITESVILAERELIAPLRDIAITAALEAGLDAEFAADVRIAATEAVANALLYRSPEPGKSKIGLRCLICRHALVIEVTDEGPGYNLKAQDANGLHPSGLGLRMMMAAMDEVEFSHDERGGRVRMLKWIPNEWQE